jgi:hypothetical protein
MLQQYYSHRNVGFSKRKLAQFETFRPMYCKSNLALNRIGNKGCKYLSKSSIFNIEIINLRHFQLIKITIKLTMPVLFI